MPKSHTTSSGIIHGEALRYSVLLPLPLAGPYDYLSRNNRDIPLGSFVYVPLGAQTIIGVVWGLSSKNVLDKKRLKYIESILDIPPLPESVRRFVDWVAEYNLSPPGSVLRMTMSAPKALEPPKPRTAFVVNQDAPEIRMTPARQRVLSLLADGPPRTVSDLAHEAGVGPAWCGV